jgi:CHAT domain-containing protein/tetratricopeptide (TPR) repeat protein
MMYHRALLLSIVTIFLAFRIHPVLSQIPELKTNLLAQVNAQQLVQKGKIRYEQGNLSEAVKLLQQAANLFDAQGEHLNLAITLINLGHVQSDLGHHYEACDTLARALALSSNICNGQNLQEEDLTKEQLEQQLNEVNKVFRQKVSVQVDGLRSFGDILRQIGRLKESQTVLQRSLNLAKGLDSPQKEQDQAAIHLSLGNTFRSQGNLERERRSSPRYDYLPWKYIIPNNVEEDAFKESRNWYTQADKEYQAVIQAVSSLLILKTKAQLNRLSLLIETGQISDAQSLWSKMSQEQGINLSHLPKSRMAIYARVNLAQSLAYLKQTSNNNAPSWDEIVDLLTKSAEEAKEVLKDKRAQSYALGNLGGLYEYCSLQKDTCQLNQTAKQLRETAQKLTQEAIYFAQPSEAPDIAYQWEWQLGRLLDAQEKKEEAIGAYTQAVKTLESVRRDLLVINADVQFSFRDDVEPVYRGLVNLLLRTEGNSEPKPENFEKAIKQIDSLQLAELENFLRCNLSLVQVNQEIDKIGEKAALIYPIILEDRLEVIFNLPGQGLRHHEERVNRTTVQHTVSQLRDAILNRRPEVAIENSKKVYKWLVEPVEQYIVQKSSDVKTLVFVLDGDLRNIPMSVLFDEKVDKYLIQKDYALALIPGTKLFDLRPFELGRLKVLAAGISEEIQKVENQNFENQKHFSKIKVDEEFQKISSVVSSKILLNTDFTRKNIQHQINSGAFSIVHMATHGNFSSNPDDTYILVYGSKKSTGELLKAKDLDNLLRIGNQKDSSFIKLLVLSACQTAQGDNRATLGLAGLAVRAGARSTVSTLWQVDDDSTAKVMEQFYKELKQDGVTKAEALHRAQKALLNQREYQNPKSWAPYVLIGNWR